MQIALTILYISNRTKIIFTQCFLGQSLSPYEIRVVQSSLLHNKFWRQVLNVFSDNTIQASSWFLKNEFERIRTTSSTLIDLFQSPICMPYPPSRVSPLLERYTGFDSAHADFFLSTFLLSLRSLLSKGLPLSSSAVNHAQEWSTQPSLIWLWTSSFPIYRYIVWKNLVQKMRLDICDLFHFQCFLTSHQNTIERTALIW